MSQENVALVLALSPGPEGNLAQVFRDDEMWAAVNSAFATFLHPDFECAITLFGTETTYSGANGLRALWLDWTAPWATYRSETEEVIDLGDRVLQFAHEFGRREGSTEEVKGDNAAVWTFREGKLIRFDAYADRAEARKALGLEE
jgi:ketosteroid isomerase-like protein